MNPKDILRLIELGQLNPFDLVLQDRVLKTCCAYVYDLSPQVHLFCTPDVTVIAVYAFLSVYSAYENVDDVHIVKLFEDRIRPFLDTCPNCIREYHIARAKLAEDFVLRRKVEYSKIQLLVGRVLSWEANTILDKIDSTRFVRFEPDPTNSGRLIPTTMMYNFVYECLMCPSLLRVDARLALRFEEELNHCLSVCPDAIRPKEHMFPGVLFLLFSSHRDWALKCLPYSNNGQDANYLKEEEMTAAVLEEYRLILVRVQNPQKFDLNFACLFWSSMSSIIECCSDTIFQTKLNDIPILKELEADSKFRLLSLGPLFKNYLMSPNQDSVLPVLLRILGQLLDKLKVQIWDILQEIDFKKLLEHIFRYPAYISLLTNLPLNTTSKKSKLEKRSSVAPVYDDLVVWILNLYTILTPLQQSTGASYVFNFMVGMLNQGPNSDTLLNIAFTIAYKYLSFPNENLTVNLLARQDFRALVDKKVYSVLESVSSTHSRESALLLIHRCLRYDVVSLIHFRKRLLVLDTSISFTFSSDLIFLLEKRINSKDIYFATYVLSAFDSLSLLNSIEVSLIAKKAKALNTKDSDDTAVRDIVASCNKYNRNIEILELAFDKLSTRITESFSGDELKSLLQSVPSALGIWSGILSPREKISQSSVGLLLEAFDVEGRSEAVFESLKLDIQTSLMSVMSIYSKSFAATRFFPNGCRIVTVLMDFSKSLFDPVHGLLAGADAKSYSSRDSKKVVFQFYSSAWDFLKLIYETTYKWSKDYEFEKGFLTPTEAERRSIQLREFTRDALDLSRLLLNGFKVMNVYLTADYTVTTQRFDQLLLDKILEALSEMIGWLRLSDLALLVSCVDLVKTILDFDIEIGYNKLDEKSLTTLTKVCVKAKGHNNKLTEQQRAEILFRARKFDDNIVNQIIEESEELKAKKIRKSISPDVEVIDLDREDDSTPQPSSYSSSVPSSNYQRSILGHTAAQKPAVQRTLNSYFNLAESVSQTMGKVDSAPKRPSMLEMARQQLAEKRSVTPVSSIPTVIHPARAPGFNKRKPGDKMDSESESEKEESDDESRSLLFVSEEEREKRMQKVKLKLKASSISKPNYLSSSRASSNKPAVDPKKKAEELMRLRLNVDMNPLYSEVLSWDYNRVSEFPVDNSLSNYTKIKDSFSSTDEYKKTFKPLLLLECWQAVQRAKEISMETPFRLTIGSRSATDSFYDIYASVDKELVTEKRAFGESDLVALMLINGLDDGMTPSRSQMDSCKINCLAKVKEIKYFNSYCDVTFKITNNCKLSPYLTPSTQLVGLKVMQMTTIEREFSSLTALQYYNLSPLVIAGLPKAPIDVKGEGAQKVKEIERSFGVNASQAVAIAGTVQGEGFSLIQGPPGTGKTKTILGILGYILTSPNVTPMTATTIEVRQGAPQPVKSKSKILICAPSNAAVDELCLRLRTGILDHKGNKFAPNVIRLGKSDVINEAVRDLTLEELVDSRLRTFQSSGEKINELKTELRKAAVEKEEIKKKLNDATLTADEVGELELSLQKVVIKRRSLGKQLDETRDQQAVNFRNKEIEKRNIQFKLLSEAQIVCSTLSGSAHDVLASMSMTFDTVIIDEAAQCIELSALIPLRYGCKKCIMVGDPNQLPPTVLSQKAASYKYEQSLFVRMQNLNKNSVYLLDIQYRMHPEISKFPSKEFYNSRLIDGPNMDVLTKREWHETSIFKPYLYLNLHSKHSQNSKTKSYFNITEAKVIVEMVGELFNKFPDVNWAGKLGIISPYKEQIKTIRNRFYEVYGRNISREIDFNTVDGFQGQEKEIIIFSCVRASESQSSIGFVSDVRRMNVALTRAKCSLWIVGNKDSLVNDRTWKDLIDDSYSRNLAIDVRPGFTKSITSPKIVEEPAKTKKSKKEKKEKKKRKNSKSKSRDDIVGDDTDDAEETKVELIDDDDDDNNNNNNNDSSVENETKEDMMDISTTSEEAKQREDSQDKVTAAKNLVEQLIAADMASAIDDSDYEPSEAPMTKEKSNKKNSTVLASSDVSSDEDDDESLASIIKKKPLPISEDQNNNNGMAVNKPFKSSKTGILPSASLSGGPTQPTKSGNILPGRSTTSNDKSKIITNKKSTGKILPPSTTTSSPYPQKKDFNLKRPHSASSTGSNNNNDKNNKRHHSSSSSLNKPKAKPVGHTSSLPPLPPPNSRPIPTMGGGNYNSSTIKKTTGMLPGSANAKPGVVVTKGKGTPTDVPSRGEMFKISKKSKFIKPRFQKPT